MNFEDTIATFATAEELALAEQKKSFEPTLAELKTLERDLPKQKARWFARLAAINRRRHLALSKGVQDNRLTYLLDELSGGQPGKTGIIHGAENTLGNEIRSITQFSLQDLPNYAWWITLYRSPERVRAVFVAIEAYLEEAEALVADGGDLHRRVDDKKKQNKSVQPASAPSGV